ncbi:golgi apyrase [Trichomonascus vanleenenianus]|uniref:golgi apyrase n=1 Tax=Trichomonascus vanleenenianus TaxID=2268995 RepID=UPI003EC96649
MAKDKVGPLKDGDLPYKYVVVIDAGSSGSRVYVYHYTVDGDKFPKVTSDKWSKKIKPGISTFAGNAEEVGKQHIKELVKYAEDIVPKKYQKTTPVFLHATAGMRLLEQKDADDILKETCQYLKKKSPFYVKKCADHVSIIDGQTEGIFGWVALNYLTGSIEKPEEHDHGKGHSTYGFLEMGGASMQIAFVPNKTESAEHEQDLVKVALDDKKAQYDLFAKTFLGLGVNEIRSAYIKGLEEKDGEIKDPCLPRGLTLDWQNKRDDDDDDDDGSDSDDDDDDNDADDADDDDNGDDSKKEKDGVDGKNGKGGEDGTNGKDGEDGGKGKDDKGKKKLVGTGDFDMCLAKLRPHASGLMESLPDFDFDINHFVGVSEYYDSTSKGFQLGGRMDYGELSAAVKSYCSRDWDSINNDKAGEFPDLDDYALENLCFKSTWVLGVIDEGFQFPNESSPAGSSNDISKFLQPLQTAEKIDGVEFTWTLGRAVLYASSDAAKTRKSKYHTGIYASNKWGYSQTVSSGYLPDLDDMLEKRSHRLWGSLVFLGILAVIVYLLLGRTKRRLFWESMMGRFRKTPDYYRVPASQHTTAEAEEYELRPVDDDNFSVGSEEDERRNTVSNKV